MVDVSNRQISTAKLNNLTIDTLAAYLEVVYFLPQFLIFY
jgi:hypothetical protein